jgi:hypothetical protein
MLVLTQRKERYVAKKKDIIMVCFFKIKKIEIRKIKKIDAAALLSICP